MTGDENLIYANISSGFMGPKWKIKILVVLVFLSLACAKDMSTHTQTHEHIFLQVQFGMVLNKYVYRFILLYSGTSSLLRCTSKEVAKLNFHALMALLRLNIMSCQMFSVLVHISLFQLRKGVASLVVILLAN